MRPLKLLVIFDNLELSGTHRVALNLLDAAPAANIECRALICMSDKTGLAQADPRFFWPSREPGETLGVKARKAVVALREAVRMARESDCILATCPPSSLVAAWASRRSGRPCIGWVHYDVEGRRRERLGATGGWLRDGLQNLLYYRFVSRMKHVVFVSESTRASMARSRASSMAGSGAGGMPAQWVSLPNIFRRSAFAPVSATAQQAQALRAGGEPLVVVVGRLVRQKRWEDALAAAAALHGLGVAAQWVFVGDGPEREAFQRALATSPVRERVHGFGADPNPLPLIAQADALVMTSLYEAWPTVILEAFDLGVPVLAYDCPSGPAEMLGHGERGWVTAEHPEAMARALAERFSVAGRAEATRRAAAAREFVEHFSPERALRRWRAYLDTVVDAPVTPGHQKA